jgi:hypothetical protein
LDCRRNLFLLTLPVLLWLPAACGGAASSTPPPPPPAADFSLLISSASLNLNQGDASSAISFSISPHNGFTSAVQITLADLPPGVTSNPASPFTAAPGTAASVVFGAALNAAIGNFTVSAQAISGALSHSITMTLAIVASNLPALPRTGFVRTDAVAVADNPPGEVHYHQSNAAGDHVVFAFQKNSGGALAVWNAVTPNQFSVSSTNVALQDIAPANDGNAFALRTNSGVEVRDSAMFVTTVPTAAELTRIPNRNAVPGLAVHPSGALIYQPFLTGLPGAPGVKGGVDISDAHSGDLRLRVYLPQQFMTDIDGLHGSFSSH